MPAHLDQFEDPLAVVHQSVGLHVVADGTLQFGVAALVERDAGEQIVDEGQEEGFVLVHQFGQIHVAKHAHHDGLLRVVRTGTLYRAQCTQNGQDVSQSEVVVYLNWTNYRIEEFSFFFTEKNKRAGLVAHKVTGV